MKDGGQWRTFPARLDIGCPKIRHDINFSRDRQHRTVTDLPSDPCLGPVQECLTVESNDVDGFR